MSVFAYARVSTTDQNPAMQSEALLKAYPEAILREESISGTLSMDARPVLSLLMDMISKEDKLVVWKLDRLSRSLKDLLAIVEDLERKGASLVILDQSIDTSTSTGTAFLSMLGVFAQFETNLRKERQAEGIKLAKKAGKYLGKQPTINVNKVKQLKSEGKTPTEIAKELKISRNSVYRILKAA